MQNQALDIGKAEVDTMLNKNWSGTMIRTDDPVWEEDLHKSNTRKWLFRFLFDGQAFCKDLSMCV